MSPIDGRAEDLLQGFPRVSGDEPVYGAGEPVTDEFSPRERG